MVRVMGSINLTKAELEEITGRSKPTAQVKWLRQNGFTVLVRADGMPLVSRAHFEAKMGGYLAGSKPREFKPNFGAL
ncbi:MAG: DUF4224 domain-containing protein [Gammaproteobacteria bacterium]|nr:DUF4224 domain-containing protein [Gammaproteobacteria bacterium]